LAPVWLLPMERFTLAGFWLSSSLFLLTQGASQEFNCSELSEFLFLTITFPTVNHSGVGGAVKIIACIEDPVVIKKILDYLDAKFEVSISAN